MAEAQEIRLGDTPQKWLKLMLYFQNATPKVFQCRFATKEEANRARGRMSMVQSTNTGFSLLVTQRDNYVYVVKLDDVRKVVLKDG